jgi:amino acid transporter
MPRTITGVSVNGLERRVALVGGCIAVMAAAGTFFVVRLVAQDGGGYSDFFFVLGVMAAIFAVGSFAALVRVARTGTGAMPSCRRAVL